MQSFEPIAAISTPYGRGGIAVIRISGEGAVAIASHFFVPKNGRALTETRGNQAVYGDIIRDGRRLDDGIATVFWAPHSYTGEDTVEISCHGGIKLSEAVLGTALAAGCRMAEGGEFTKRAFLNGKIGLSEAEAVIGLIDAENEEHLRLSAALAGGVLHTKMETLAERLTEMIASVYAYIDYPDEDLSDMSREELLASLVALMQDVTALSESYRVGHAVSEGIKTVIVGKPNVGKSSLLNQLLGYDRAIVTSVPGTTRDTIEEKVTVGPITLSLCDTAGLHTTDDPVEQIGVGRSLAKLSESELMLAVFDATQPLDDEDRKVISHMATFNGEVLVVLNKADLSQTIPEELRAHQPILLSAKTGAGTERLTEVMIGLYVTERIDYEKTPVIANARQYAAVAAALSHLSTAKDALSLGFTQDIAGLDLELALGKLKELDGRALSETVTDRIFSRFCVGK